MRSRDRAALLAAAVVVGIAAPVAQAAAPAEARPSVVVAVADTGVNPYHDAYYRPQNTAHPCRWVKGFTDCSIPALRLSVDGDLPYREALARDADVWAKVKPGQWYWIPRTNIIGAVCDTTGRMGMPNTTCILDDDGHGTGTTSSVVSEAPEALLLVHDGSASAEHLSTAPVLADVQSHSWGAPAPLPDQAAAGVWGRCLNETPRRPESLYFRGAGNNAPFPSIADCRMQPADVQIVGGGAPGYWTPSSWSTFDFASWYCRPVARHDLARDETGTACGTSFASPTAAGAAAHALLRIRQREGYAGRNTATHVSTSMTRERFLGALRSAATYTPRAQYSAPCGGTGGLCADVLLDRAGTAWAPLPPEAPYAFWGYGWLDATVADAVVSCALRSACPAKSADAEQFNAVRRDLRRELGLGAVGPQPQQDAGSQRDAGKDRRTALSIAPGRKYDAQLDPLRGTPDSEDVYVLRAAAGQRITVTATASGRGGVPLPAPEVAGCWSLLGPGDEPMYPGAGGRPEGGSCDPAALDGPPSGLVAPVTGTYLLRYTARTSLPHDYRFSLSLER